MTDRATDDIAREMLRGLESLAAEMRTQRKEGVPLDDEPQAALIRAFVDSLRAQGWLQAVDPEQLDGVLDVVVIRESDGSAALDIESEVTGSSWLVPGWGVTKTDPAEVGRGLAEDEGELLGAMREAGETTGWE